MFMQSFSETDILNENKTTIQMESISNLTIQFPGKLVFGKGCLSALPDELLSMQCSVVYIITIEPLLKQIEQLTQKLKSAGIEVFVNTNIVQEPTFADFENLMCEASGIDPDTVLGIGGGSVLDIAKLV